MCIHKWVIHTPCFFYILISSVFKAIAEGGFATGSLRSLVEKASFEMGVCVMYHNAITLQSYFGMFAYLLQFCHITEETCETPFCKKPSE